MLWIAYYYKFTLIPDKIFKTLTFWLKVFFFFLKGDLLENLNKISSLVFKLHYTVERKRSSTILSV